MEPGDAPVVAAETAIDRALGTQEPALPAEIKAKILENFSDCRHLKDVCTKFAEICAQHNVYSKFVAHHGWNLQQGFTAQQFDDECAYYTGFLRHEGAIKPDVYDIRISYVNFVHRFVSTQFNIVIDPQHGLDGNPDMQREEFANRMVDKIGDKVEEEFLPMLGLKLLSEHESDLQIRRVPHGEEHETFVDENGTIENMDVYKNGFHFMVTSKHNVNAGATHTIVHNVSPAVEAMFDRNDMTRTVKTLTQCLIGSIDIGVSKWRAYTKNNGHAEPDIHAALWDFQPPEMFA